MTAPVATRHRWLRSELEGQLVRHQGRRDPDTKPLEGPLTGEAILDDTDRWCDPWVNLRGENIFEVTSASTSVPTYS